MKMISQADFALSTMWNFRKASSGAQLMDQIRALGFTLVELNYQVKREWIPDIERFVRDGKIKVSSIHNVFPKVVDERFNTDSVLLGYEDEALRKQSIALCKQSIDWACTLGAGAVVFHPTEVPLSPDQYDIPLKKMIAAHENGSDAYMSLQREMVAARQSAPYVSRMLKSIEELADYVTKNNLPVKLGMENRSMCHQVPIFSEFEIIAEAFGGGPVGIWLDTGHAIMMEELGLQHMPLSQTVADCIVGMHIHDAVDGLDHYPPCTLKGDVLAPYMAHIIRSPIKVLELSGRLSPEEILRGTENLIAKYNEIL